MCKEKKIKKAHYSWYKVPEICDMEEKSYSDKLKSPYWQRKRLEIMKRDDFKCLFCGDKENTLHIHHVVYLGKRNPWEYDDEHLVTLCESCHQDEEKLKDEDKFLVNMFSLAGLSRRQLYSLASALRMHLRKSDRKIEKFQDLTDYLHNG